MGGLQFTTPEDEHGNQWMVANSGHWVPLRRYSPHVGGDGAVAFGVVPKVELHPLVYLEFRDEFTECFDLRGCKRSREQSREQRSMCYWHCGRAARIIECLHCEKIKSRLGDCEKKSRFFIARI